MTSRQRPIIAITMGDASGVGPEVIVKALRSRRIYGICRPLVIGEGTVISDVVSLLDSPLRLHIVDKVDDLQGRYGTIDLLDLHNLNPEEVVTGKVCAACGKAAMDYITKAAELALKTRSRLWLRLPSTRRQPNRRVTEIQVTWNFWRASAIPLNTPPCWSPALYG